MKSLMLKVERVKEKCEQYGKMVAGGIKTAETYRYGDVCLKNCLSILLGEDTCDCAKKSLDDYIKYNEDILIGLGVNLDDIVELNEISEQVKYLGEAEDLIRALTLQELTIGRVFEIVEYVQENKVAV